MSNVGATNEPGRANALGALFMVASMAGFAVEDMFLKSATQHVPVGQAMVGFGLGGVAIFWIAAVLRGEPVHVSSAFGRTMMVRNMFEIGGRLFYTLAIALTPLSSATAILQAAPLVMVAGAAVIFGERVGWRRWSAILIGLIGVLVILRPGAESFSWLSVLAVLGMLGFAGRDLATRAVSASLGTAALGVFGFATIVVAGTVYAVWSGEAWVLPGAAPILDLLLASAFGAAGYAALTLAMRTGEISSVTPFRYSRLIFGIVLGVVVFGERPDAATYAGSAIIVLSGLYILARARIRAV